MSTAIATQARGLAVEVPIGPETGITQPSVVNADGIHTISQRRLTKRLGAVDYNVLDEICAAVATALGCDEP